jgi:hypothetical protein
MSELGESAIRAIEWLATFHKDVSKLISSVEDNMRGRGLISLWTSTSISGSSATYYNPSGWMPRYLYRSYVPAPQEDQRPELLQRRWAFFLVYLTPKCKEPMALWGVASLHAPGNPWDVMKPILLRDDGPPFLDSSNVSQWENIKDRPESVESLVYRACPIVELKNGGIVEEVVVSPLVERLSA